MLNKYIYMIFLWVFKHKNLSRQRVMSHLKAPPGPRLLASNSYRWEAVTSEVTPRVMVETTGLEADRTRLPLLLGR